MDLEKRIVAFIKLGVVLRSPKSNVLDAAIDKASKKNRWFTWENVRLAIASLGEMLEERKMREWMKQYESPKSQIPSPKSQEQPKKVGVIMAGNIPLVGFHDFLCVLMSGNTFVGKLSSEDEILLPAVSELLCEIEPGFASSILFTEKVQGSRFKVGNFTSKKGTLNVEPGTAVSAFIATGSNNSARYFEYYFGKHPHIIRKNRNSVAVLDGTETESDLKELGKDIFQYFGMGCRNVSKVYVPANYELDKFFASIVDFGDVINHNKYYNNYQYYRTIYLLNSEKFLDNNFLMLKESEQIASPVATLYYERYSNKKDLFEKLLAVQEQIQSIVSNHPIPAPLEKVRVRLGQSQSPELWDYSDGVDTMQFLLNLK